ncbi:hypothetical protein AJ79_00832 [Helicocarpus griseus UAMH5409]|uniref:Protein kinase domain-containing protein n=1 Tax=Helicocarpus griseus UAMH5409 TaxID=1447875 RepID=A0A2B7YA70_9EURO|nr:hypothetical protein AJ79_00832 [Helicocarpus griseus UAMH5409]
MITTSTTVDEISDMNPSDVVFLQKLRESKNSVIFKVSVHGKLCVMKVQNTMYRLARFTYFHEDKVSANAVLIEYIPNMQSINLSNYSSSHLDKLRNIIYEIHQARVIHGDPMPRNMMISPGKETRLLWIDFDSAQTLPEASAPTSRQQM